VLTPISLFGKVSAMHELRAFLNSLSPQELEQFAHRCAASIAYLRKAISVGQPLGEGLCLRICVASGFKLRPEVLRPDVDWDLLRCALETNKPELVCTSTHQTPDAYVSY